MSIPLNSELRIRGICLVRSGGLWEMPESIRDKYQYFTKADVHKLPTRSVK